MLNRKRYPIRCSPFSKFCSRTNTFLIIGSKYGEIPIAKTYSQNVKLVKIDDDILHPNPKK